MRVTVEKQYGLCRLDAYLDLLLSSVSDLLQQRSRQIEMFIYFPFKRIAIFWRLEPRGIVHWRRISLNLNSDLKLFISLDSAVSCSVCEPLRLHSGSLHLQGHR